MTTGSPGYHTDENNITPSTVISPVNMPYGPAVFLADLAEIGVVLDIFKVPVHNIASKDIYIYIYMLG